MFSTAFVVIIQGAGGGKSTGLWFSARIVFWNPLTVNYQLQTLLELEDTVFCCGGLLSVFCDVLDHTAVLKGYSRLDVRHINEKSYCKRIPKLNRAKVILILKTSNYKDLISLHVDSAKNIFTRTTLATKPLNTISCTLKTIAVAELGT